MPQISPGASIVRPGVFALLEDKIQARMARGESIVPLHIGDTHLMPPTCAQIDTVAQEPHASLYRYGPTAGVPELRSAIAASVGLLSDPAAHVHIGFGATHAFYSTARALLGNGDEVLVAAPYWPLTPGVFHACGVLPIEVDLSVPMLQGESLDVAQALEAKRTSRTRAIYLASPNNPDGFVWHPSALRALYTYAEEHDLWVFSDEVYRDFVYEGSHLSARTLDPEQTRTIVLGSLSKSHALAGYRIGYAIANADVVARARRISTHTGFNVPVMLQHAAARALRQGADWLREAKQTYADARTCSMDVLSSAGVPFVGGAAGSYVFVDLTEVLAGREMHVFLDALLDRGVLLAPGASSGASYQTWARICYTSAPKQVVSQGIHELIALARTF